MDKPPTGTLNNDLYSSVISITSEVDSEKYPPSPTGQINSVSLIGEGQGKMHSLFECMIKKEGSKSF
jgi:hypothetical protein